MQCIWLQFLATHVQRDLVAFSIYGYDVQETNDDAIPDDVAEKILRFARSAVAAGWMKNKAYAIGFYRKVRHLLRDRLMRGCLAVGQIPIQSNRGVVEASSIANRGGGLCHPRLCGVQQKTGSFTVSLTKHVQVHIFQPLAGSVFFNKLRHRRSIHNLAGAQ